MKHDKAKQGFVRLLNEINRRVAADFCGIGLVLYASEEFPRKHCSPLRPSIKCPQSISMNNPQKAVSFFCRISRNSHRLHDGYHLLNTKGQLTHISQYFWPPIIKSIKPNESYGTRHLSAKYGSCIKGVIAIGIINQDRKAFCFIDGENHELT